jgi:hypothetical protein
MPHKRVKPDVNSLARQLALSFAEGMIESACPRTLIGRSTWFNVKAGVGRGERADVALSVRYLELRGLIERHPSKKGLVRVLRVRPEPESGELPSPKAPHSVPGKRAISGT